MIAYRAIICILYIIVILSTRTRALYKGMNCKQYDTIESYVDADADPCTDFYQYACGNWKTLHTSEHYDDSLDLVDYKINQQYAHILKARKRNLRSQHKFVKQAVAYYNSCNSVINYMPLKYLRKLQRYEQMTWPDITRNNSLEMPAEVKVSNSSLWLKMLATLRKYELTSIFISEGVFPKEHESTQYLVEFDRPTLEDEFEALNRTQFEMILEYLEVIDKHRVEQLWQRFHNFELKFLKLYDIEDTIGYEVFKLSEISMPEFQHYLELILDETQFDLNMPVGITNRAFFHALFKMLRDYDDEFIYQYIMVRFLWHLHYDAPIAFKKIDCISNLRDQLPLIMTWLHEQNNPELVSEIETIKHIFENLRTHFSHIIAENPNNFDDEVLEFLSTKLKRMQLKVGNLPRNETIETLQTFHRELSLSETDFYGNHLKVLRFRFRSQHVRLQSTLPQDASNFYHLQYDGISSTSTPYYLPRQNMVIVPLTLLHSPFYHPQLHDIYKYSLIGFLLAHEITHGFDESGLDYDENGNIMRKSSAEVIKGNAIFDEHLDCLLAKNPKNVDEKIADVSGLRWAYETYFSNVTQTNNRNSTCSQMPQKQLFFRNFALFFCGSNSSDNQLVNSSHGTYRSRLYDTLSQFAEFGRAYKCSEGSSMNPLRKCQLWR